MASVQNQPYAADFFRLQLQFARKVAALTGVPITKAIGTHTNLYIRLGMGREFDPDNVEWQRALRELVEADDPAAWTRSFHLSRSHLPAGPLMEKSAGCFSYSRLATDRVRLHFHAPADEPRSTLSDGAADLRRRELRELFAHLKTASPSAPQVVGASWLYNLPSYRWLFPVDYLAGLRPIAHPYQRMPLWGQFLARNRTLRTEIAGPFEDRLAAATTMQEVADSFPLSVLAVTASAECFYEDFGL